MIPGSYVSAAFLSNATQTSLSETKCPLQPTCVPPDNTVSGSISPKWITRSTLSVTSNLTYCVSVTFLSCNRCSWLKVMRETLSYSYNPLTSQTGTRALAHQTPCGGISAASNYAICAPRLTSHALLHLISLDFHLLAESHRYHTTVLSS